MANVKFTELPENTGPTSDDIVAIVNDPTGTPTSMKVRLVNLLKQIFLADQTQLSFNTVTNGEFLKRVGSNIDSAAVVVPGAVTTSGLTQATSRLLGRTTALSGAVEEISVAGGLTLSAGILTGTGGGSSVPTTAQGDILYASATNVLSALNKDTNATRYLSNTGGTNNPAWAQVAISTGVSGLGSNVATFLATPSSANLAAALTDETGSGAAVFGTTPTIGTPIITSPQVSITAAHGSDDTYTGTTINGLNNTGGVTQWDTVYLNSSSQWVLADANGTGTYPARGLATATASTGNATNVLVHGTVRHDAWNWTPGGTLYLSGTAGGLTQTAPAVSGDNVQQVGFALTADIAFFDFNSTYVTVT